MTTDAFNDFSENLKTAVATALQNHVAPPVLTDIGVCPGDIRPLWTSELANSELVHVVRLLEGDLAIVVHVHTDPDMAASNDAVIPPSFSESGFTFVVRSPLHTTVPISQLGPLVDRIDDQLIHNIETFLVGITPKPPLLQGSPVAGPRDPRWLFLDDTHERFVRLAVGAWTTFLNEVITPQELEEFAFDDRFEQIRVFMLDDDPQITPELVEAYVLHHANDPGERIDLVYHQLLESLVEKFVVGGFYGRMEYLFGVMQVTTLGDSNSKYFAEDLIDRTRANRLESEASWISEFGALANFTHEQLKTAHLAWTHEVSKAMHVLTHLTSATS